MEDVEVDIDALGEPDDLGLAGLDKFDKTDDLNGQTDKINLEDDFEDLDPTQPAKNEPSKQNDDDLGDFEDLDPDAAPKTQEKPKAPATAPKDEFDDFADLDEFDVGEKKPAEKKDSLGGFGDDFGDDFGDGFDFGTDKVQKPTTTAADDDFGDFEDLDADFASDAKQKPAKPAKKTDDFDNFDDLDFDDGPKKKAADDLDFDF